MPEVDGEKLSMSSIPFAKNDPKWKDQNGDNIINDDDRILKGHALPPVTGSFVNNFKLGRFDLGINLFFALGHDAINYRSSQRYNFLTLENIPSLESLREIFFWQNTNDKNDYPLYNQMSGSYTLSCRTGFIFGESIVSETSFFDIRLYFTFASESL